MCWADGMGGHQAGEVASALAARTLCETLRDMQPSADALTLRVSGGQQRRFCPAEGG